jgi:hypothetical protein
MQLRDYCSSLELAACVVCIAIGLGGGYGCNLGQKRNHKFCRKDLFWYPITFALHYILFKREIFFVKGKGTVYLR